MGVQKGRRKRVGTREAWRIFEEEILIWRYDSAAGLKGVGFMRNGKPGPKTEESCSLFCESRNVAAGDVFFLLRSTGSRKVMGRDGVYREKGGT